MKSIATLFDQRPLQSELATRNAREDIIAQIVARMTGDRKQHAKLIALWANRYRITETDLHALLRKADDPTIRNFTAFVRWSIKDRQRPAE